MTQPFITGSTIAPDVITGPERPVSVLLFHPADVFAGAERSTEKIVKLSNPSKLRFVVVSGPNAFHSDGRTRFISLFDLGISNGFGGFRRAFSDALKLYKLARAENCDVALGMLHYGAFVVALMRIISFFRLKAVASPRTPSKLGIEFHVGLTGRLAAKWRFLVRFFCQFANRVVVPSNGMKDECVRVYGAISDKVAVIHNGIDKDLYQTVSPTLLDEGSGGKGTFKILTFARLAPEKDLDTLLQAFARARMTINATLWIVGDGPERERLQSLVLSLDIKQWVHFTGFHPNPFPFLKAADIFVHTALFEGFPNVVQEAMACGIPVIATDCDFGPREIIHHGTNGLLVPVSCPEVLAEALITLYRDPSYRAQLAMNAHAHLNRFDVASMVAGYERIILGLFSPLERLTRINTYP
jgi:glycosyltransferase involved in cell wall biosynthesis